VSRLSRFLLVLVLAAGPLACYDSPVWGSRDPGGRDTAVPWDAAEDPDVPGDDLARDPGEAQDAFQGPDDPGPQPRDDGTPDAGPPPEPGRLVVNTAYEVEVLKLIKNAQQSIQVCMLEFLASTPNSDVTDRIQDALIAAAGRGVDVTVLLDGDVDDNAARVSALKAGGVTAKLGPKSPTLHVKLVVVDGARALVGSTNWSTSSLRYNNEANLSFDHPQIASQLGKYAASLYGGGSGSLPTSPIDGVRLIGDRQYADAVVPILRNAKTRVRLVMYQYEWSTGTDEAGRLSAEMVGARQRGVDVRVLLEKSENFQSVNEDNERTAAGLAAAGISVRMDPADRTTHTKLLLADDTLVVYSGNWVFTGLEKNHEAGAAVGSPNAVEAAAKHFDALWSSGTPAQ
jgi:phosphatidylserine/phosphatidylglycerophosphate/cardiolipin synthase-like enzyme